MNLLGVNLILLLGPTVAVPAPQPLTEALDSVEVTHNDSGRSGFQLTFKVGRSGPGGLLDYPLEQQLLLRPFNRVILLVRFDVAPEVLMDGFITQLQLTPSDEPGKSTLTVTGEDVSVMMDLVERKTGHPAQAEPVIAAAILARYTAYLLAPPVIIPTVPFDLPPPTERIPAQAGTDFGYLNSLASRFDYIFYVRPGLFPGQNIAYWGPAVRVGLPQAALSVNQGPHSNVEQISFTYNALSPAIVVDSVLSSDFDVKLPVIALANTLTPPLVSQQSPLFNLPHVREKKLSFSTAQGDGEGQPQRGGMTYAQAWAKAQAMVNDAAKEVVSASGSLDALRYGHILKARGLVGLRGAGLTNDGLYYVKTVSHSIRRGDYKQRFSLTREGVGTTLPVVRP